MSTVKTKTYDNLKKSLSICSDSGNSMNFEIMLQLFKPYSMALEQVIIFDLRERIVQYFQLTRRRREVSNFGFVPSSLIIQSTRKFVN